MDKQRANPAENDKRLRRFIRRGQLPSVTGLGISTIYELVSRGEFPRPVQLGRRAVGWSEDEIAAWQSARIRERDGEAK